MQRCVCLLLALAAAAGLAEEPHPGIVTTPVTVEVSGGVRLAGVLTRPDEVRQPPVIHFVQWLSCDTVMLTPAAQDGWSRMLRRLVRESSYAVLRVDKRGVGDSNGGPCSALDFDTELADHRAALAALGARGDVDTRRIVVFGASMGARYAPLIAVDHPGVAGVLVWGGGALTWFERMLAFDRQALELGADEPGRVNAYMRDHARLHAAYLLEGRDPPDIIRSDPALAAAWARMVGTGSTDHYGRPFSFHQQAAQADWAAAWARIRVPVLALQGELDWFESPAGGLTIERLADTARFEVVPRMDHHFTLFDSARAAFQERGGRADPAPFLDVALPWLREIADAPR